MTRSAAFRIVLLTKTVGAGHGPGRPRRPRTAKADAKPTATMSLAPSVYVSSRHVL